MTVSRRRLKGAVSGVILEPALAGLRIRAAGVREYGDNVARQLHTAGRRGRQPRRAAPAVFGDCDSAAPPSTFIRCFNRDKKGVSSDSSKPTRPSAIKQSNAGTMTSR